MRKYELGNGVSGIFTAADGIGRDLEYCVVRPGSLTQGDLTGEVPWVAMTIARFGERAAETGARIVHSCGFDSIPSDLGTWFVQREMLTRHGVAGRRVRGRVGRSRGGASGGTVASLLGVMEDAGRDRSVRKLLADPYSLNPLGAPRGPDRNDSLRPLYDPVFEQWTGPFVMAAINTRVVRRQ